MADGLAAVVFIAAGIALPFLQRRFAWMRDPVNRWLYGDAAVGRRVDFGIAVVIGITCVVIGVLSAAGLL